MIIEVREKRLLWASGALRKKIAECERLARDVKIRLVYEELKLRGEGYNESIRILGNRFDASTSTVKRAIRKLAPSSERRGRPPHRAATTYPVRPPDSALARPVTASNIS
jgi:hypothetical protein